MSSKPGEAQFSLYVTGPVETLRFAQSDGVGGRGGDVGGRGDTEEAEGLLYCHPEGTARRISRLRESFRLW